MSTHPIYIYAHRGANRVFPENTLPAFEHAIKCNATHLEMDVHPTKDSAIVVFHDPDGRRVAGINKPINTCTLSELQSWDLCALFKGKQPIPEDKRKDCYMPTFQEVLEKFPNAFLNVDIKENNRQFTEQVVELLHTTENHKRVLLASFHSKVITHLRSIPYKGSIGTARWEVLSLAVCPPYLYRLLPIASKAFQVPTQHYPLKFDTSYFINRAHALGIRVDYWTINDVDEALRLLKLGADGIITDDVEKLKDPILDFARKNGRKLAM